MDRPTPAPTASSSASSVTLDFGDGSDGAAVFNGTDAVTGFTLAGSTYTATTARFYQWTDCTISNSVIVKVAGCPILVSDTLTMLGTSAMHANGNSANADTGGAASHSLGSTWLYPGPAGGNGRTNSGNGSTGGGATANTTAFGGAGGAGGNATNTGGAASTPTFYAETRGSLAFVCDRYIARAMPVTFTALIGGAAGGGGAGIFTVATGASGGGGGAGGVCIIKARSIVGSATTAISANGGAGANGAVSGTTGGVGGGGGGGAGFVGIIADTITGAVAVKADGGPGGAAHRRAGDFLRRQRNRFDQAHDGDREVSPGKTDRLQHGARHHSAERDAHGADEPARLRWFRRATGK
jgi:hypothetical protein